VAADNVYVDRITTRAVSAEKGIYMAAPRSMTVEREKSMSLTVCMDTPISKMEQVM